MQPALSLPRGETLPAFRIADASGPVLFHDMSPPGTSSPAETSAAGASTSARWAGLPSGCHQEQQAKAGSAISGREDLQRLRTIDTGAPQGWIRPVQALPTPFGQSRESGSPVRPRPPLPEAASGAKTLGNGAGTTPGLRRTVDRQRGLLHRIAQATRSLPRRIVRARTPSSN